VAVSLRSLGGKRFPVFMAKAGLSACVLAYLASRIDLHAVGRSLAAGSPRLLVLAFLLFLLLPVLGGLRWWMVLRAFGEKQALSALVVVFSVASSVAQVLPSVAGDGVRMWLATRLGLSTGHAVRSVFLERVSMVAALLAVALATSPWLMQLTGSSGPVWAAAALFAGAIGAIGVLAAADRLWTQPGPRLLEALRHTSADTRQLFGSKWNWRFLGLCVASNLSFAVLTLVLTRALSLHVAGYEVLAIMPWVTLASTMPVSFGGWGVREGALVFLLGRAGVAAPDALAVSLLFGLFAAMAGLPGLLAWGAGVLTPRARVAAGG
jgi:glycosyltransferase 2 family protein